MFTVWIISVKLLHYSVSSHGWEWHAFLEANFGALCGAWISGPDVLSQAQVLKIAERCSKGCASHCIWLWYVQNAG
eukprot:5072704-Amphidinium_carterae.2